MAKVFRLSIHPKGGEVRITTWARGARGSKRTVGSVVIPREKLKEALRENDVLQGLGLDPE